MLHTHDPKVADTEEFAAALADATAVWFDGGRQWNLVDSYRNTRTHRAFHKVLERGGVIAGSSAGATIRGDYLVRGAVAGPDIVMTPEKEHERGLNFLRNTAIDQHINTRRRWDDLIPVIKKYPELLGLGLSEGAAIVVKGDRFEVMCAWKVAVHDNQKTYQPWENMKSYWESDQLTFLSGSTRTSDWKATLERYRKKYQSDGKEMGSLSFEELSIDLFGAEDALARGRFRLQLKDAKPTGVFTLILRRTGAGWRIIHDHTSS